MTGTFLNVAGILIGCVTGLAKKTPLSAANQNFFKVMLGVLTIVCGLRLIWVSLNGTFLHILKEIGIVLISLAMGRLTGRLLRMQNLSNRLGQFARKQMSSATPLDRHRFNEGFNVCAALFCAGPLGILGAIQDGLSGYFYPLAIKAAIDGLAAMSFVLMFGWSIMLSALPVMAFQGTITLLCARFAQPFLATHGLIDSVNVTGGFLIFSVALLMFEVRRVPVISYLPSLVFAPLISWWLL